MLRLSCSILIGGLGCGICAVCCWAGQPGAAHRQPVPDAAATTAALALIKQAYEDEFAAAARDPEPLIKKLLAAADETQDPSTDYVLFLEAEKAAVAGGAVSRAMEAVDARAEQFEVDGLLARVETIADCLTPKARTDIGLLRVLWNYAVETVDRGLEEEALPQAKKAADTAGNVARAILAVGKARKDQSLLTEGEENQALARGLAKTITRRIGLLAEYRKAVEKLAGDGDDAKANGVVGRYLCLECNAWPKGLAALAKGDDEDLARAATRELQLFVEAGRPPVADDILALADDWWKASDVEAVRRHAAALYDRIVNDIADPTKRALVAKRIAAAHPDAEQLAAGKGPHAPRQPGGGRRIGILNVPTSTLLPVPRDLSADLVPLLFSEDELRKLQNRLSVKDEELGSLRTELWRRIHSGFNSDKWTLVDLLFLIELNDRLGGLLGGYEWRNSNGNPVGGDAKPETRSLCATAIAAAWILTAKSEDDFVRRARALPAGLLNPAALEAFFSASTIKNWLVGLGDDYASIPRKARALDSLIQVGFATPGILRYRDELGQAAAAGQR